MEPFKTFFSPGLVTRIADHLSRHEPDFDGAGFQAEVLAQLDALELKARAQAIADALHARLPGDPADRARVLLAVLHPDRLDHANLPADEQGLCGWAILPLTMVVGQHGIADFDRGMELLREMTMRFSSEFAVRHFLLADQPRALAILSRWTDDPNRHVRRLVSEGTRPRLPWAMQLPGLIADPGPALPLLERLRDDPEDYVRRSVANHLNDIAKDHPGRVTDLLRDWMAGAGPARQALLRHAARTLVKRGDPETLAIFGREPARLRPVRPRLSATSVAVGGLLRVEADLTSTSDAPQALTVDLVVHFRKANGGLSPKVFKGGNLTLAPGKTAVFSRQVSFRPVTTRRLYPGGHAISLRINGADTETAGFTLLP
ncbi:MAG: hypothetical protein RLZZ528_2135 [Pseudomonadota bacterium]